MIKEIKGDIIRDGKGMICHQCNYQGVMGAGVAYQIKRSLLSPSQYAEYKQLCFDSGYSLLGTNQYIHCDNELVGANHEIQIVVNMFCQNEEHDWRGSRTNYDAMRECFNSILINAETLKLPVYIPGYIGCGLAGGDWDTVKNIIWDIFEKSDVEVTIVYWEKT